VWADLTALGQIPATAMETGSAQRATQPAVALVTSGGGDDVAPGREGVGTGDLRRHEIVDYVDRSRHNLDTVGGDRIADDHQQSVGQVEVAGGSVDRVHVGGEDVGIGPVLMIGQVGVRALAPGIDSGHRGGPGLAGTTSLDQRSGRRCQ